MLFVDKQPVGVIEAKKVEEGFRLTDYEEQSRDYAESKLKYLNNDPLPFVYESTGELTRFTDYHDPKPRSRPTFTFHKPETFREWQKKEKTLRKRLLDLPLLPTTGLRDCQIIAIRNLEKSFKDNRLIRLEKQITENEKNLFTEKAQGKTINQAVKELLNAYDPDIIEDIRLKIELEFAASPPVDKKKELTRRHNELIETVASIFTGDLNSYIENVRKAHEQIIDDINRDKIIFAGWDKDNKSNAAELVESFKSWIETHKNEIVALQIFYNQPLRRREITFKMMKELVDHLISDKPLLAPLHIWQAYSQVEKVTGSPKNEMIALISLLRKITGIDKDLTSFDKTVDKNFREWVFKKQAGTLKFNDAQMSWLRMIKDHIATSIHLDYNDLEYTPFDALGGKGKMWQLFGEDCELIIAELNEVLAA
jgi:type I restriction enzyme R subunit